MADQSWRGSQDPDFSLSFYQSLLVSNKDLNRLYFLLASIFLFLTLTTSNQRRFRQDVLESVPDLASADSNPSRNLCFKKMINSMFKSSHQNLQAGDIRLCVGLPEKLVKPSSGAG